MAGEDVQISVLAKWPSFAPRAKLLKPLFATLRKLGHLCFGHIDDTYLQGDTVTECSNTIDATVALFTSISLFHTRFIANACSSHPRQSN